jgi:hypothetical protein
MRGTFPIGSGLNRTAVCRASLRILTFGVAIAFLKTFALDLGPIFKESMHMSCGTCESLPVNVYCGRCVEARTPEGRTKRARRKRVEQIIKRRGKRGALSVTNAAPTLRVRLICEDGHRWFSELSPEKDADSAILDPRCMTCRKLHTPKVVVVQAIYNDAKTCDRACWDAVDHRCSCQCAGANHGLGSTTVLALKAAAEVGNAA